MRRRAWQLIGLREAFLGMILASLPRLWGLGTFMTIDEPTWMKRSQVFAMAILNRDWKRTDVSRHPGVTLAWLGAGSMAPKILWEYADQEHGNKMGLDEFVKRYDPAEFCLPTQVAVALSCIVCCFLFILLLSRLTRPCIGGYFGVFIALEPVLVGYSKVFHMDMLMTSFMGLSFLCVLLYLKENRLFWCAWVGVFGALATLTKISSFFSIFPLPLVCIWKAYKNRSVQHEARALMLCGGVWILLVALCWPAFLFHPLETLKRLLSGVDYGLTTIHGADSFFMGKRIPVVGPSYIWIGLLCVTSPLTLMTAFVGLERCLAFLRNRKEPWTSEAINILLFVAMAFAFTMMMMIGAKRAVRYNLIMILAWHGLSAFAVVWWMDMRWIKSPGLLNLITRFFLICAAGLLVLQVIWWNPHEISYVTPLIMGRELERDVLLRGWGEGLEMAARYLNTKPKADSLIVATWYDGSFSPFFRGTTKNLGYAFDLDTDYVVLYANQVQRGKHPEVVAQYWDTMPEYIAKIKGREMAWVYKARPG